MPTAWCQTNPKLGEREVAEELFGHPRDTGALREGMVVLAGKTCGSGWKRSTTPARTNSTWKAAVAAPPAEFARIAQRLLALARPIWHNWMIINVPVKRSLIAYDR